MHLDKKLSELALGVQPSSKVTEVGLPEEKESGIQFLAAVSIAVTHLLVTC